MRLRNNTKFIVSKIVQMFVLETGMKRYVNAINITPSPAIVAVISTDAHYDLWGGSYSTTMLSLPTSAHYVSGI